MPQLQARARALGRQPVPRSGLHSAARGSMVLLKPGRERRQGHHAHTCKEQQHNHHNRLGHCMHNNRDFWRVSPLQPSSKAAPGGLGQASRRGGRNLSTPSMGDSNKYDTSRFLRLSEQHRKYEASCNRHSAAAAGAAGGYARVHFSQAKLLCCADGLCSPRSPQWICVQLGSSWMLLCRSNALHQSLYSYS